MQRPLRQLDGLSHSLMSARQETKMLDSYLETELPPFEFRVIRAFAVAALLRALESGVALALEGAFCVDAAAVSAQTEVLALVNVCPERRRRARRV